MTSFQLEALLSGAGLTVFISVVSMALAIFLGLLLALARLYGPAPLRWLALIYVEFFRGIPVLLLLVFLYYVLPVVGTEFGLPWSLKLERLHAAILGFGLNYAAYEAEIYRAGISSVAAGQWEAAASLGMGPVLTFRRIILPQALRVIVPPMTNDFVALFKDTSVASVITVKELNKEYQILVNDPANYSHFLEIAAVTAALYLFMSVPLGHLRAAWRGAGEAAMSDASLTVTLDNVSKRFGDRVILDGVNLSARAGETLALLGPSGGGKSTLLRCINGLTTFDGGAVRVGPHVLKPGNGNREQRGQVQKLRRLFGMVFQDFQLFPHLTALQNVMEGPIYVLRQRRDEATKDGMALLERVGLADRAGAYPAQLSGGQKQRVAIARALAMKPRGLLCDEITSALDPELKHEVLEVLEALKRDGLTLLVVTHEIGFARRAADRVVVLADGKIIEEGPPAHVIERPQVPRTQQFLRQVLA